MATKREIRKVKHSYGVLLYRVNSKGKLEVFLGKANSPRYWSRKTTNIWGIPKGQAEKGEKALHAALREFEEEVGIPAPPIVYEHLIEFRTPHSKRITVFVASAETVEVSYKNNLTHKIEWPAKSGNFVEYAELSDAQWFTQKKALSNVMWGQKGLLKFFFKTYESKNNVRAKTKPSPSVKTRQKLVLV